MLGQPLGCMSQIKGVQDIADLNCFNVGKIHLGMDWRPEVTCGFRKKCLQT